MPKPVIFTIDDDPEVLGAIERDLRRQYRGDYRILKATSGAEALDAARRLKSRNQPVALFLSDERMPGMSGTQLLVEVKELFPQSRRVLLTAYSDTEAAIKGINEVGLDYYLLKPWDPPQELLYPLLDDLLGDWAANAPPLADGIRVVGARWSRACYDTKDFLSRNQVPYQWVDIEQEPAMRALVEQLVGDVRSLPVVFFPDGEHLVAPTKSELAVKVGMQTQAKLPFYDLAIVGGGPAGLAAAVYGASEGLHTILVEQQAPGGQAGTSSSIENYLGFPAGVTGADLARRAVTQARRFGAEVLTTQTVKHVTRRDPYRVLHCDDGSEISCKAVVLATGVAVRELDVPGVPELTGTGIYYGAARTEAASYRGDEIGIVGGANSAGQGALFFSRYAARVTLFVRGDSLSARMSQYLVDRIEATPTIEVVLRSRVDEVRGTGRLSSVVVADVDSGEQHERKMGALFVFIGAAPRTDVVGDVVRVDDRGYVLTGLDLRQDGKLPRGWALDRDPYLYETSVPGIFAVGDVRSGSGKRVAAAVGEGSATVGMVHRYLESV